MQNKLLVIKNLIGLDCAVSLYTMQSEYLVNIGRLWGSKNILTSAGVLEKHSD
jgi:hypothetical protein